MKTRIENDWCVYIHTNKINGKKYIGQTCRTPEERWNNGFGYISSTYFFSAIKKYGWNNFEHRIVAHNLTKEQADNLERFLIKRLKTTNSSFGYNLCDGGSRGKQNEATRIKMSQKQKGRKYPPRSKEYREKISKAQKKRLSDPTKNPMYGKKRPDTAEFNRRTKKGKKQTAEHILKRVLKNTGQHRTKEVKERMSEAAKRRWANFKKQKENRQ